jgi:leucyl-tRNA synthetase
VEQFGADTLRVYEMFIGPFDQAISWNAQAVSGVKRFLDRVYTLSEKVTTKDEALSITHQTIKKITEDIDAMSFNTSVSQMMIMLNALEKEEVVGSKDFSLFVQLLAPFAPHLAEELWSSLGNTTSVHTSSWPVYDESKLVTDMVTIAIQIAGKMRGTVDASRDLDDSALMDLVKSHESYQKYVGENEPKKVIIVKNKIVNVVL